MILAIDIGNTSIHMGLFHHARLMRTRRIRTDPSKTPHELVRQVKRLGLPWGKIERMILCSVVPRMSTRLIKALRLLTTSPIRVVGRDIRVPLINRYRYPKQVGQDRLVGAYAAWRQFKRDCIVADFGTAITIDVVTKRGEYLGGVIVPGLKISLEALAMNTALLPKVTLREPPELLGRDTASSIRSGVLHGYAALCDGVVAQLKARYAPQAAVVATGGASPLVLKHTRTIRSVRPFLVLEGLYALASLPNQA